MSQRVEALADQVSDLRTANQAMRAALEFAREELWHWTLEVERAVPGSGKGRLAQDALAIRGRIEAALAEEDGL